MIKIFSITSLLFLSLVARENPFFPTEGQNDIPLTTNIKDNISPLHRATLTLPSTARVVESFTVTYKNLDGSISQKSVTLGNSIDWHLPLFLTQSYDVAKSKDVVKTKKRDQKKLPQQSKSHSIDSLKFVKFSSSGKSFYIKTQDEMLRDFILTRPHRIVADFKRESDIPSYLKKNLSTKYFKELRIGNHKGYYRVVITLDGYYKYKKIKTKNGYKLQLI